MLNNRLVEGLFYVKNDTNIKYQENCEVKI